MPTLTPVDLDRLRSTLMTSGLQTRDQPTFQVIDQLIKATKLLQENVNNAINNINNIINNNFITVSGNSTQDYGGLIAGLDREEQASSDCIIPGPRGDIGPIGNPGYRGLDGIDGTDGLDGFMGIPGINGANGINGTNGSNGLNGFSGQDGLDGQDGIDGFTIIGPTGPIGIGLRGPSGLDGNDGEDGFSYASKNINPLSAQDLTNGVTGSGVIVLAVSPVLTGSPSSVSSFSTPSLISPGAITVTPLAGSNLNVVLSATGDLAINTSQLYVDTSLGFIGIGTATPNKIFHILGSNVVCKIESPSSGENTIFRIVAFNNGVSRVDFGDNDSEVGGGRVSYDHTTDTLSLLANLVVALSMTSTRISAKFPINLINYTVATLPTGVRGDIAYVTDALAPTFLSTLVGGGAIVTPCFFNGTNWVGF